jgi:hypothetical protein
MDTSRDGNDAYLNEVWSLIDVFGVTIGLRIYKWSGWAEQLTAAQEYSLSEMEIDHPEILQRLLNLL